MKSISFRSATPLQMPVKCFWKCQVAWDDTQKVNVIIKYLVIFFQCYEKHDQPIAAE